MGKLEMAELRKTLLPLAGAGALTGAIAWFGWKGWEQQFGHASIALEIGAVFVPAGIAGGIYWLIAMLCKVPAARELTDFALAKFKR
jgi:hypothetical protein